jgi:hypothetical protein
MKLSYVALGSLLFVSPAMTFESPALSQIMQNTRTSPWVVVTRATVPQSGSRIIRVSGPWMGKVTSVTTSGGVSARNIKREDDDRIVTMVLDASSSAPRGNKNVTMNVRCDFVNQAFGCVSGPVPLPVKVLETGPVNHIFPNGTVPANSPVTFDLDGEGMDVAVLLPRLLTLKNATILSRTAGTIRVRGTTPSCGYIDVALSDAADGDENPYRKGSALQSVLSGRMCSGSLAPPLLGEVICAPGTTWNQAAQQCQDDD